MNFNEIPNISKIINTLIKLIIGMDLNMGLVISLSLLVIDS